MKEEYSKVRWREIAGMRDKLIHNYFGVNLYAVCDTTKEDTPALKKIVTEILMDLNEKA